MSSNINYLSINENFPVAGQDNDTQVFRDNFDTIKTSLRLAKEEITALQDTTAKLDTDNDFGLNLLQNAVLQNVREGKNSAGVVSGTATPIPIDYQSGSYHIYTLSGDTTFTFQNLPGDPRIVPVEITPVGVGKLTIELYNNGDDDWTVDFSLSGTGATSLKKDPDFPSLPLTVSQLDNVDNPIIIEVWRHSLETIFVRYLGTYAE